MNEQQNNSPRQTAINALISWAKTGWGYYSMRDAVDNYLESCGANRPSIGGEETILAHRKIAANRLAIDCIYALSKEELQWYCQGKALVFTDDETYKSSPFALLYSLS